LLRELGREDRAESERSGEHVGDITRRKLAEQQVIDQLRRDILARKHLVLDHRRLVLGFLELGKPSIERGEAIRDLRNMRSAMDLSQYKGILVTHLEHPLRSCRRLLIYQHPTPPEVLHSPG
jgi:hypothetical protein